MEDSNSVMWRQLHAASSGNDPAWSVQPFSLPIPNLVLREISSVGQIDVWFTIGEAWADFVSHFLSPNSVVVLDIGCGCGKLARFFYLNSNISYIAVDLFLPAIEWCQKAFAELGGKRFRFEHFDGHSTIYNPKGQIMASEYSLPAHDCSIDVVVCASLFTHLLVPDCTHYLAEIFRVLKPGGRAIISIHTQPPPNKRFSGDETRVDIEEQYFIDLANLAGLSMLQNVGLVYGQQVLVFSKFRRNSFGRLLAPPNSRRAWVLRRLINVIFVPLKKIRRNRKLKEDLALIKFSSLSDEDWYLTNNPDVARAKVDPLLHYLRDGGFEGRDPGPNFSSAWYLTTYEDVKKAGINPLVHYLKYGRKEGRAAQPDQAVEVPRA